MTTIFAQTAFSRSDMANEQLAENCDAGEAEFCAVLKIRKFDGSDGGDISERTIRHFDQKCETDGEACYSLAAIWYLRQGASRDFKKATKFAARSCQHDYALGCVLEGSSFGFVTDDKAEYQERFFKVNSRACQLELAEGCVNLFEFYYKEERIKKNLSDQVAIDFLKRACALRDLPTCVQLADFYWRGRAHSFGKEFPQNRELALQYYELTCDQGFGQACAILGRIFEGHVEMDFKDIKKARPYYEKACKYGGGGCREMAVYYQSGPSKNLALAEKYEVRSCKLVKLAYACFEIAKRTLERDPSKTETIIDYYLRGYQLGCEFGIDAQNCVDAIRYVADNTKNKADIKVLLRYANKVGIPENKVVCKRCE